MHSRQTLLLLLVGTIWTLHVDGATPTPAGLSAAPGAPYRAPYLPSADDEVLQEVPAAHDSSVRRMRALRGQLDAKPTDFRLAQALARAYIDFSRELGDAHYVGYAEAVIAPWVSRHPPPADALVLQATILQYRHQFHEARAVLAAAIKIDPRNAQGWLTLATLDMVQGDYDHAARACGKTGDLVVGIACTANLRSYTGRAEQSVALLDEVVRETNSAPASFKAWIQGMLAESEERLGAWPQAETYYRSALTFAPRDNFLRVAYADFLLDRGRPEDVLALLGNSSQSDTAFLRIALAKAALKSPDAARYTWVMAARFEALKQRGSDYFGREQVRFALELQHDPQGALALAQRNWEQQRAPWDVRVFLEAALAARQPQAAVPVLDFVQQTKLQDPVIASLVHSLRAQLAKRPPGKP